MSKGPKEGAVSGSFLEKLTEILSDETNTPYICWQPSGMSFLIKDVADFEAHVLTKYFKHSNHNSFVRQLNMYNFVKTCNDANYREFHNPNFQRDRRDLMVNIKRKASQPSANANAGREDKKPQVEHMTQRQKAMMEQQERENERAEAAKRRRDAARAAQQAANVSNGLSPGGPVSGGAVSWDPKMGYAGTGNDLLSMVSPFDYNGNESPFTAFRMDSVNSINGEPLLLPSRRNPEGIHSVTEDNFAFARLNSLDPNNIGLPPPPIGRARSNSGSSVPGKGGKSRGGFPHAYSGQGGAAAAAAFQMNQDTINRVRELETRNFLLTERFNELRSQSRTVMLLLHGFLNDIVDAENLKSGSGTPVSVARRNSSSKLDNKGISPKGSPRSDGGGDALNRVTRAVATSAATALQELSPLVYQQKLGVPPSSASASASGSASASASASGSGSDKGAAAADGKNDENERGNSPAARALKAAGGSSGDLMDDIADKNTQDAVDLIKSMRSADAKTNEGANNFVSLISSIQSSATKKSIKVSALDGLPIVKQSSLPASFAPFPQPQLGSPKNSSVDGGNSSSSSMSGMKREREEDGQGTLAGKPLKKLATINGS